ncbi:MAG TPA: peptide chain release factor N(5)-glutamine methyltransferase [Usitatibacteraceae bacterium]|nr:peptide chain release factor N(5)-glutamine methyltransferase [Usitatibacteraceae bacterium]
MNIAQALARAAGQIERMDAQYLLAALLQVGRAGLMARPEQTIDATRLRQFEEWVARRARGEPVAYLLGSREFYGREFAVSPAVLIPRPETEHLVEQALACLSGQFPLENRASPRVLDLGTGSGAIAITLALEHRTAGVCACDCSADALAIARRNALHLGARVEFIESDWYAALGERTFDLIVANPPYVAAADPHLTSGDLRFEPAVALSDRSPDGLGSIRAILDGAPARLAPRGWLLLEHGYDQAGAVRELLLKAGFSHPISVNDLSGIPRVAGGRLG